MKKKMIYVVAALVLGAVTVFNVKTVLEANSLYDLTQTSIAALSYDGESVEGGESSGGGESDEGGESDSGANITDGKECHNKGGDWNVLLKPTGSGIEQVSCERSGELACLGFTLYKYTFHKGKTYIIKWERRTCESNPGSCCIRDKQGLVI